MENHEHSKMSHEKIINSSFKTPQPSNHHLMIKDITKRFWISLILTIPVIVLSPVMGMTFSFQYIMPYGIYIVAIIGTILFIYGGQPFFKGAKEEFKSHKPGMMSLITLGISVAYIYSMYAVLIRLMHRPINDFFWELATLIDIMLLGHVIELKAVMNAQSAVDDLSNLVPDTIHSVVDGQVRDIPLSHLKLGDIVEVRAGENIPTDGIVCSGETQINESIITGEERPIYKAQGSTVIAGSTNESDVIHVKVTATGDENYLSKVNKLVAQAEQEKTKQEVLSDKVAGYLFYIATFIAIIAFFFWSFHAPLGLAFSIAVTVLVIACPHALGLAVPLVVSKTATLAAKHGLVIRRRQVLENISEMKFILMSKTGIITQGDYNIKAIHHLTGKMTNQQVLQYAATLEQRSKHPIAKSIVKTAKQQHLPFLESFNVEEEKGVGMKGFVNGNYAELVSPSVLKERGLAIGIEEVIKQYAGDTLTYLLVDGRLAGVLILEDQIKKEAFHLIQSLKAEGYIPVMLTGDNKESAISIAKTLGIDEVQSDLKPKDKVKWVHKYQQRGKVLMVGDGMTDASSLVAADIGIAMGVGMDVNIDSADIVLVNNNPDDILAFITLARHANRKMKQNLWWGAGYNIIALPLAAGFLAPIGIMLSPTAGALLMSVSTIIVAINAMTLKM